MISIERSLAVRALTFGYANARVKAMKQSLLSSRETQALAEAKDNEELFVLLERTSYKQDLVSGALREKTIPDQIELACSHNFSGTLEKIIQITPKKHREKIRKLFEKYEINNIKAMLNAKHTGLRKDEISQLILETGILSKAMHNRLLSAKTVREIVIELGVTPYGRALEKVYKKYEKEKEVAILIAALDEYYYNNIPKIAKLGFGEEKAIISMLKAQADAKNISSMLRGKKENLSETEIRKTLVSEGSISKEKINRALKAKSVEESAKVFERTHNISMAIDAFKKTGSLIPIELELEKGIARKGLKTLRTSNLSLQAIAGFLLLKEEEINNIRKIARAKEFSLSPEKMKEMLVEVQ